MMLLIFYCNKTNGRLNNFFNNKGIFAHGIVCGSDEEVYEVDLVETTEEDSKYVGYLNFRTNEIEFVFNSRLQLSCCFPYGLDVELNANRGRIVYLKSVSETNLGKASDLEV